ncbi:MAG: carbon monoxide dehydrogenase subunit G [Proteobacteria bacterium]|nr:carbon monoxide dehydrogenase subunit G [Pseudomonadota bacterium]
MDFSGRYLIPASPKIVWAALTDAEILKSCIPGCERVTKTDDTHFEATASLKIGPVKATFKGNVALENLDPPHRATLKGEGQGGVAGFAKGEAEIALTPEDDETVLTYTAKANVGGKLAQIGQRLIDGAAKQIADDFFARFAGAISAASAVGSAGPAGEVVLDSSMPSVEPPLPIKDAVLPEKREGVAPEIWVVGLVAVIIILLVLFSVSL